MSKDHPTTPVKPDKPYPDFPLTAHPAGYWCKKIRGKIHYFGRWDAPDAALAKYLEQKDALHAGRKPREDTGGLTVKELANAFLNHKDAKLDAGELSARTRVEYQEATDLLVKEFGKGRLVEDLGPDDFLQLRRKMARRWGPIRLGNVIQRIRTIFKYAIDNVLIDRPPRFGTEFKKPDKAVLRRHRAQHGQKMLEVKELHQMLGAAPVPFKAMLLLGLNCGFGNTDVASLPLSALDLDAGWIDFPRPKTGIARRCPLWPETVAAIREALAARRVPKDEADADIVFILPHTGGRWVRTTEKSRNDNVSIHFTNLMKRLGIHHERIGFYALRHIFRTIADAARDPVAIDAIMGHSDPSMAGHYRERIEDSRLRAVADYVRGWLFPTTELALETPHAEE